MAKIRGNTQILAGSITNTEVDAAAAIAYSKLNLATSILNADIAVAAAIVYSKLSLADSILNADINTAAAIAYSKLNLTNEILNADIDDSAAIVYSKLSLANSILNADVGAAAAVLESKLAFHVTTGHHHDGTDSRLVAAAGNFDINQETPGGTVNGTNTAFTLATSPTADSELLFLNGVMLERVDTGSDITNYDISGTDITMGDPPSSGDSFLACYGA